jgi:hypothetical protein
MAFCHRHAAQNEIRYEAKFVPKIEKERGREIAVFFRQSSPPAQDFLGMMIRKRVS